MNKSRGTTIIAVSRGGRVAMAGDGQVTVGNTVLKHTARKIRRLHHDRIVAGFAGATADAFTLFEKFEGKLVEFRGNLRRSAVELAKDWRTDRILRRLDALMVVTDGRDLMLLSGSGDVVEPDDGVIGVGSGGSFAMAAARAMLLHTDKSAADIARESLRIASEICIFTNANVVVEEVEAP
ncbi:MAG: ATP-dependent protease subunit HslV [Candidatus Deferrimicrobiaceae bacterium]